MGKTNFVNRNELVHVLKEIKDEYGQSVMRDPMKFKAFLHDYLPDYSRERRLLEAGIEEGIFEKLLQVKSQNPADQVKMLDAFVNQLMRERGLAKEVAEYTVSVFAEAMEIKPEQEKYSMKPQQEKLSVKPQQKKCSVKPEEDLRIKAKNDTEKAKPIAQEKNDSNCTKPNGGKKVEPPRVFQNRIFLQGNDYYAKEDFERTIAKYIKAIISMEKDSAFVIKYESPRERDDIRFIMTYPSERKDKPDYEVEIWTRNSNEKEKCYKTFADYKEVIDIFQTVCVKLDSPNFQNKNWKKNDAEEEETVQNNHVDASNIQSYNNTEKNNKDISAVQANANQQYASGKKEEKSWLSTLFVILVAAAGVIGFVGAYSSDGSIGLAVFAAIAAMAGCSFMLYALLYTIVRLFWLVIIFIIAGFFLGGMEGAGAGFAISCFIGFFISIGSSKNE